MGSVYKRGNIWWIRYRYNGQNVFESSKSTKKMVAVEKLRQQEGDISNGGVPVKVNATFAELAEDFITDYKVNAKKSLERAEISVKHLEKYFGRRKASSITTADMKAYTNQRLEQGAKNGTVNRELRALGRMLKLAYQDGKISRVPHVPTLKEGNPRQGFFESDEYLVLLKNLDADIRPIVTFAYRAGWRKSEILSLEWDKNVDLKNRTVTLQVGETKNDEGRTMYLDDDLLKLLRHQKMKTPKGCPYVFHRKGEKIKDFRGTWKKACKDAGLSGRMFHDFRRTCVRNLTRSGVQESVAMKLTGHKTRTVFDRYNITSQEDLRQAAERQAAYLSDGVVTKTVTIGENEGNTENGSRAQVIEIKK